MKNHYKIAPVKFYAIRIKGTNWFKSSGEAFEAFDIAMKCGVYYNQLETAEKNLKKYTKMYKGGNASYPKGLRFTIPNKTGNGWKYYYADQARVDEDSMRYEVNFWDIELEIVELNLEIAE